MKTETQYYIKKFKLDQENFQFNRQEFIDELSKNFLVLEASFCNIKG